MKFGFILIIFFSISCAAGSKDSEIRQSTSSKIIIAKVAGKEITLDDFLLRAEYTLRPAYCKGSTNNDKNIVLNTLIAEKLIAINSPNSEILKDTRFQKYIAGRREQKMRDLLYINEAVKKIRIDTSEIKTVFSVAGRNYKIQYYNISEKASVHDYIVNYADQDSAFESFFKFYGKADSIRGKEISWDSPELPVIHKALFSGKVKKGQVIGPVSINDSINLIIKITGWNDRVVISEKDIKARYDDVLEKLTTMKADSVFEEFVLKMMGNRKLKFNTDNLNKLVKLFAPYYLNRKEDAQNELLQLMNRNNLELPDVTNSSGEYSDLAVLPLFEIDGQKWSIGDLKKEIDKHPLVFRKNSKNNKFAQQLRLAIVDLIRDVYLTREAYKKGLDKSEVVRHYEESWFDAGIALFQRNNFLNKSEIDSSSASRIFESYLNPYIKKY